MEGLCSFCKKPSPRLRRGCSLCDFEGPFCERCSRTIPGTPVLMCGLHSQKREFEVFPGERVVIYAQDGTERRVFENVY